MLILDSSWPLLLIAAACLWLAFWQRRTRLTRKGRRLKAELVLRFASLVLLGLALCAPRLVWQSSSQFTVFALDVSESMAEESIGQALDRYASLQGKLGPEKIRLLAFAETAAWWDDPQAEPLGQVRQRLGVQGSNFEQAIRLTLAEHPERSLPRLLLWSDGRFGEGNLETALAEARSHGLAISAPDPASPAGRDCWIGGVSWPAPLAVGQPGWIEVAVYCPAVTSAELEVWSNERKVSGESLSLRGGDQRVSLPLRPESPGLWLLQLRLKVREDPLPVNDVQNVAAWVSPARRVWLLNGPGSSRSLLPEMLRSQGFEVQSGPRLPSGLAGSDWDSLLLNNVHPSQLTASQMDEIRSFVSEGGGLVFLAGENSFGARGYSDSELERVLPITFEIKEEIGLALLLLLDKSNSMKGEKIELARQATLAIVDQLQDGQSFGVVAFDHQPHLAVPLQELEGSRREIRAQVEAIVPGAHTNIMPALEQSYYLLAGHPAASRHIILLSDGRTYPDDYEEMVKQIHSTGITVSTVGIGSGADQELLRNIAEWGEGRGYFADDPQELPKIFLEETLRMQASVSEETLELRVRQPVELLSGIPLESAPALAGLVRVKARPEADVILETTSEDPVLVRWRYGLGTAVFVAVDLGERWTADWLKWPYLTRLTSQLVRDAARAPLEPALRWSAERVPGNRVIVTLQARDAEGNPRIGLRPVLEVTRSGQSQELVLTAQGSGKYQTELQVAHEESVLLRLLEPELDRVEAILPDYPKELQHRPPDRELLQRICEESGGKFNPADADLLGPSSRTISRSRQLWPWLTALAVLAFLAEIGVRRWPI